MVIVLMMVGEKAEGNSGDGDEDNGGSDDGIVMVDGRGVVEGARSNEESFVKGNGYEKDDFSKSGHFGIKTTSYMMVKLSIPPPANAYESRQEHTAAHK